MISRILSHNNFTGKYKNGFLIICLLCFLSCTSVPDSVDELNTLPAMYPDYTDVTIPYNIAPLNFKLKDEPEKVIAEIKTGDAHVLRVEGKDIRIPMKKWKRLLADNKGKSLEVKVYAHWKDGWKGYPVFKWNISAFSIDPYLAYRLIEPGYFTVNRMGLFYRNVEAFEEKAMVDNKHTDMGCVNCHAFCQGNPDRMLFHARNHNAGTYLYADGELVKLNTKAGPMKWPAVYPFWHPSGDYIAFSNNPLQLNFFSGEKAVKELYDLQSDVVVYDVRQKRVLTTPYLYNNKIHNNYPVFSPDGRRLYFCSHNMPDGPASSSTKDLKLSLCAVDFDAATGKIGQTVDTLVNSAETGKSLIHPRVSPDGKYIVCTQLDHGSFYYYKEADLAIYDIEAGTYRVMDEINSPEMEGYHSWSSDNGWMVFSSQRVDGYYSLPWFSFVDENGRGTKPFVLPQKDPDHYTYMTQAFNVPELIKKPIPIDSYRIYDVAKNSKAIPSSFRMQR